MRLEWNYEIRSNVYQEFCSTFFTDNMKSNLEFEEFILITPSGVKGL